MKCIAPLWTAIMLIGFTSPGLWGQSAPASQPTTATSRPASQPTSSTQPINRTDVAVTVGGHQILEGEIDDVIRARWPNMGKGGDARAHQMEMIARDQLREELICDWLLDRELEKAHVTLSDEEVAEFTEAESRGNMSLNGWTRDELDARFRREKQMTLDQFVAQRKADPARRAWLLRNKFLRQAFPDEVRASNEDIKQFYDVRVDQRFKRLEQVRASHILFSTVGLDDEQRAAARKKAAEVLEEVKQPGADFAALAAKYSSCLTREKGGDVGYFTQQEAGDTRFGEVAFKLKVGEISDVVETKQGFDIIKVTDRREPLVIPLEQAKEGIRQMIEDGQIRKVRQQYCEQLRQTTKVDYPPDKPPRGAPLQSLPAAPGQTSSKIEGK